ncbi:MAG: hypothetical protein IJM90_05145 [Firmicutes bacterium]|nr:hypothetical protein [Bacillota bacterium]
MADLRVITDHIDATAESMAKHNIAIRDRLPQVQRAITSLNNSWDGAVSDEAISKFYEFCDRYPEPRYQVMDQVVQFLRQQVGTGYEQTESVNRSLADAFR